MSEDEDTYDFSEQESDYLDSQSFELYDESELEEILDSNEVLDLPFDPENISEDDFEEILEIEREVWRIQSGIAHPFSFTTYANFLHDRFSFRRERMY